MQGRQIRIARDKASRLVTRRQEALLVRLEEWFDSNSSGLPNDAASLLNIPLQAVEAVVKIGIHEQRLVRVGDRVFTIGRLNALVAKLQEQFGVEPFHPRDLREALGYSRQWTDRLADVLVLRELLVRDEGGWRLQQSP
jgi:hypothetical protein